MMKSLAKASTISLFAVAAIGIAITAAMFAAVRNFEQARVKTQFLLAADQRLDAVRVNVDSALETISFLASYFSVEHHSALNRRDFKTFVTPALAKHDYLRALEWIPQVNGDARGQYERLARADGMRDFALRQLGKDGVLAKAGPRDQYFPVFYVEPLAGNERALGYDLASDQLRLAALTAARDTGGIVATAPVELVQDKSRQYGTLVFAPVYNRPEANNVHDRRQSLVGFALGVFRIADLISTTNSGPRKTDVAGLPEIRLFDITAPGPGHQLYPRAPNMTLEQLRHGLHAEEQFEVGGRTWLLLAKPAVEVTDLRSATNALIVLGLGLLLTSVCLVYLRSKIKQSEQIAQAAFAIEAAKQRLTEAQRIARLGSIEHLLGTSLWTIGEEARAMLKLSDTEVAGTLPALLRNIRPGDLPRAMAELSAAEQDGLATDIDFEFQVGTSPSRLIHALGKLLTSGTDGKARILVTLQDVTAYRAEQMERTKLLTILEQSPDFMDFVNPDGTVGYLNPADRALIGVENLEETKGKSIFDYEWPEDRELHRSDLLTTLKQGESWQGEYRLQHQKTGEPITVDMRFFCIVDCDGTLLGAAGICRDIRERKRAEQKLFESETRFLEFATAIREVFWMIDVSSNQILYVSPAYEEIWGRSCAELYADSSTWLRAVHEEDRARVERRLLDRALEKTIDVDYRVLRPDGSVRWVRDRAFLVRNASGTVVRVAGVASDITEQRQAHDTLATTQRLLASIVNSSENAITGEDLDGIVTAWNHGAEKAFGYTAEEMIGRYASLLYPQGTEQAAFEILQSIRDGQRVEPFEAVRQRKDGQLVSVLVSVSPILDQYGTIIGASNIARDITDRKKLETRLSTATEQLREVLQSTQDSVIALNDQWRITYANWLPWGADASTAVDNNLWELYPQLAGTMFDRELRRALKDGYPVQFEEYCVPVQAWFATTAYPSRSGLLVFSRDVTEKRSLEVQARHAQKMEAIGQLAAGIAHEINTPVQYVGDNTNFLGRL
jgi:PAS domain S-box-containing protein